MPKRLLIYLSNLFQIFVNYQNFTFNDLQIRLFQLSLHIAATNMHQVYTEMIRKCKDTGASAYNG